MSQRPGRISKVRKFPNKPNPTGPYVPPMKRKNPNPSGPYSSPVTGGIAQKIEAGRREKGGFVNRVNQSPAKNRLQMQIKALKRF